MEERLKQLIREVCDERGAWIVVLETMADHVHLLVEVDPLWTNSYFVATTGGVPLAAVKEYVEQQKSR